MKTVKRIRISTLVMVLGLLVSFNGMAQQDASAIPSYKKFPNVPPFKLLLTDSVTTLTKENLSKKKPTMIMLFSPDCDHCKHETEELIKRINDFNNVQIIMATPMAFDKMKEYYNHYGLSKYKNIKMGKDSNFMLPVFFNIRSFPFLAFYNKKQELISVFEGSMPMDKVLKELKK